MPLRLARLFPQLRRLTIPPDSDAELLQRFARGRDEAAFAELVARHGPMVFRVCRRVLGDVQTAEDAFQAAFLVLARKAGTLGQPGRLAAWLYGVAYRVALKARQAGRREGSGHGLANAPEPHDPHPDPLSELSARELLAVVEEEVQRLPEAYRWPVILCCLEGLSLEEAAQRLGATTGSLRGRLERGRKRLGDRLAKRGLTLAAALAAVEVARAAPTPALLSVATVRAALAFATNSEAVSGTAAALAKAALPTIASGKVKLAAALLLALSAAAVGAGVLTQVPAAPEERGRPEAIQDGQQQAAGHEQPRVDRQGDPLPPGAIARLGTLRFRHGGPITAVAVSPDGKLLASVGGWIGCIWELATGKLVHQFPDADDHSRCEFSADGKLLIVPRLGQVDLWDVRTGKQVAQFREPGVGRTVAALSPDGKTIALAFSEDSQGQQITRVKLRDLATGKERLSFGDSKIGIGQIAFTPDGKTIVTTSWRPVQAGTVNVAWAKRWDAATGKLLSELPIQELELVTLSIAPDGRTVIACPNVAAADPDAADPQLWDTVTGKRLPVRVHARHTLFLALTPDGKKMATASDGGLHVWDTATGKAISKIDLPLAYFQPTLALTPDGKTLVSADLRRWDTATGKEIDPSDAPSGPVSTLAFSPDGSLLASAGASAFIHLWESRSGKEIRRLRPSGSSRPALTFTRDGTTLIGDGGLLWDAATGRELPRLHEPAGPGEQWLLYPTLSPDGKTLACFLGERDAAEIVLFDLPTRKELRRFGKEAQASAPLAFSPDGKTLVSGQTIPSVPVPHSQQRPRPQKGDGKETEKGSTLLFWEVATGQLRGRGGERGFLGSPTFSADGKTLLGVVDGYVRAWEVPGGRAIALPQTVYARDVVRLSDRVLAVASWHRVRLCDTVNYNILATLEGHRGSVNRLAVSADGRLLASAGNDGTVLIWNVEELLRSHKRK